MANLKKTYFLTPSFDYPPTGPILLGNLLAKPENPDRPLNGGQDRVPPPPDALTTTTKTGWKANLSKGNSGSVGLYAKFLETLLGAGIDVGTNWEREKSDIYEFSTLETTFFDPSSIPGYLSKALSAREVTRFLERHYPRKPLYLITGVKIVRGGKIATQRKKGHGGTLDVGLDGTMLNAPVTVGPKIEVQRERGEGIEWGASDDFIFAYRLSRIKVSKKEIKEEGYVKGALYKYGLEEEIQDYYWDGEFEGDEVIAGEYGDDELSKAEDEDGEEVGVVLPPKEDEDEE